MLFVVVQSFTYYKRRSILSQKATPIVHNAGGKRQYDHDWVIGNEFALKSAVPGFYVVPSTTDIPLPNPSYDTSSQKIDVDDIILDLETCVQKHLETMAMHQFSTARLSEDMEESSLVAIGYCRESIENALAWMKEAKKAAGILNQGWRVKKSNDEKGEDLMWKLKRAYYQQHHHHRDDENDQVEHHKMHSPKTARRAAPDNHQVPLASINNEVSWKARSDGVTKCELTLCNPRFVDNACRNTSQRGVLTNPRQDRLCDICLSEDQSAIHEECRKKHKQEKNALYLAAVVLLCIIVIFGVVVITKDLSRKAANRRQEEKTLGLRDEDGSKKRHPMVEFLWRLSPSLMPGFFSRRKTGHDIENGEPSFKRSTKNKSSSDTSVPTPLRLSIGRVSSELEGKDDFLKAASYRRTSHSHGNSMDIPPIPMANSAESSERLASVSHGSDSSTNHAQRGELKPDNAYSGQQPNRQRRRGNPQATDPKNGYLNTTKSKTQPSVGRSSSIDSDDGEGGVEHRNRRAG